MAKEESRGFTDNDPYRAALSAPRTRKNRIIPAVLGALITVPAVYFAEDIEKYLPEISLPSDPSFYIVMGFMTCLYGLFGGFRR